MGKKTATKKPAKSKKMAKPAENVPIRVTTESKQEEIEWNYWHKPMVDSILAFKLNEVVSLAKMHNLVHVGEEREPITADTVVNDLFRICETLIRLHLSNWRPEQGNDRPLKDINIYRDDTYNLVAEEDYTTLDEDRGVFFDPKLSVTLYTASEMGPWFQINFQMVSQFF